MPPTQQIDLSAGIEPIPPSLAAAPQQKASSADFMAAAQHSPISTRPLNPKPGGAATSSDFVAAAPQPQPTSQIDLSAGLEASPDGNQPPPFANMQEKILGRNPVSDTLGSVGTHLANAITIPFHMITDKPKDKTEKVVNALGPGTLPIYRFLVSQGNSTEAALTEAVKQAKAGNVAPLNNYPDGQYHPSAQSSLMDAVPVIGPMYRGFSTEAEQKGILPATAGLVTDLLAPEAAIKGVKLAVKPMASAAKATTTAAAHALTGTAERNTANMVREIGTQNEQAIKDAGAQDQTNAGEHMGDVQDALAATDAASKAAEGHAEVARANSVKDTSETNQAATETHAETVDRIHRENAAAVIQHAQEAERIRQLNEGLQQTAGIRDRTQAELADKTQSYFDKEAEVKARVKAENDVNWDTWREKVAGKPVDMEPITETIQKLTTRIPEVDQILRETSLAPEEGSPAMERFEKDRAQVMEQQGYKGDYQSQSPAIQDRIDDLMDKLGIKNDAGEEFDPESTKPLSIEKVHDLKTQIGWKLFRNEYAGNIKYAMQQIYNVLQRAEANTSGKAGALDDLIAARDSHQAYQEGFGRTKTMRLTEDQTRERSANPEAFRKRQEDARVAAAAVHEPSLADDYKEVKQLRTRAKTFKTDEQYQKMAKQPPQPPTLENGKLKPIPEPPEPQQPEPQVAQIPKPIDIPDRPNPEQPDLNVVSPEGMTAQRTKNIYDTANRLASIGKWQLTSLAGGAGAFVGGLAHAISSFATSIPGTVQMGAAGLAAIGTVLAVHNFGRMLENPNIVRQLAKPSANEFKMALKLPENQRAGIEAAIIKLNEEGMKSGKLKQPSPWIPFLRSLGVVAQAQKNAQGQQQPVVPPSPSTQTVQPQPAAQ